MSPLNKTNIHAALDRALSKIPVTFTTSSIQNITITPRQTSTKALESVKSSSEVNGEPTALWAPGARYIKVKVNLKSVIEVDQAY